MVPFASRYSYAPANRCIYCGASGSAAQRLGDEHIIPLSFGGNLILPRASCRACERLTTAIEDHCVKGMISTARPHLGIAGRQKRRNPLSRGPVYIDTHARRETRSAPIGEHPGAIIMPIAPYPAALAGAALPDRDEPVSVRIAIKPMSADLAARASKFTPGRVSLTKGLSALMFYKFVAKIAHAYTAAELGVESYTPFLINLIRGEEPMHASHFIGSGTGPPFDPPSVGILHELNFIPQLNDLIVVRLRFFAELDMPTHYAVVGVLR
jgi:hypothetical protein